MNRKIFTILLVLCFLTIPIYFLWAQPPVEAPAPSEPKKIVKAIEVKGNKTIAIATIITKIKTRVGQEYLENVISDDIKRLYNTGFFSDVSVDRQDDEGGFKVLFYLTEKPIVEDITFSKTRQFNARTLQTKIETKKGKFLDKKVLKDDTDKIKELYAKKGLTAVTVDVETDVNETTNKVKLHFVIYEGDRVKIKRIKVYGNHSFPDKRIIRAIKARPAWVFYAGYLKEDLLKEDMERIVAFYEKEGFIDAQANYTIDYPQKSQAVVTINIEEGARYYVEDIAIEGNKILSEAEIKAAMEGIKAGGVFSRDKLTIDISKIRSLYFDKGYIFAKVHESTSLNPQGKVNIKIDIEEGGVAYVNKIKIQGNTRTRDIVIRRELRLHPGDQFDGTKLRRSKERLQNLEYFEEVGYDIEDTNVPDRKDLVVQVKEAKTGTFSFGGGYSTVDQLVGFVEIEQKNFDFSNWPTFTGGGQNLLLRAETGSSRNNLRLSFTEPWIFDYPISGGFDGYRLVRQREKNIGYAYDEKRIGGDIRFGKQFSEYLSGDILYRLEEITIDNFADNVSADLLAEEGKNKVSSAGLSLNRDTRDSVINPKKGLVLNGSAGVAGGILGGDKDFYRFEGRVGYYIPLKFNSVLEFHLRSGIVNAYGDSEKVPIFERYFAGGARTIRGYNERRIGPLDPVTEDPIGGEGIFVGNVELTIPLIEYIKLAGFLDTGNVWSRVEDYGSTAFKSGAGLGLRVKTPIGPINLDYGYPLNDEPGEDQRSGKFYFSVSRGF